MAPSKRAVSSRRASSPRARTSARSARTSSMGGSTWACGRGSRPRRSPSTPRRSSRCSTWRGYVRSPSAPKPVGGGPHWRDAPGRRSPLVAVHRARRAHRAHHRTSPTSYQGSPREDVAADLYEVERNLQAAARRLRTLVAQACGDDAGGMRARALRRAPSPWRGQAADPDLAGPAMQERARSLRSDEQRSKNLRPVRPHAAWHRAPQCHSQCHNAGDRPAGPLSRCRRSGRSRRARSRRSAACGPRTRPGRGGSGAG